MPWHANSDTCSRINGRGISFFNDDDDDFFEDDRDEPGANTIFMHSDASKLYCAAHAPTISSTHLLNISPILFKFDKLFNDKLFNDDILMFLVINLYLFISLFHFFQFFFFLYTFF